MPVRPNTRIRARDVRAGNGPRHSTDTALRGRVSGCARVAVTTLGEPGRPRPRLLALFLSKPPGCLPRIAAQRGRGDLLPRGEQTILFADPSRSRRGLIIHA